MVSFYGFFTTFTFLIGISSIISFGFILNKYHLHSDTECYVDLYNINYDLYDLVIFLLSLTIFTSFAQIVGYCGTHNLETSWRRNFINILFGFIFIVQVISCCSMIYKFDKNHDCLNFYKDSNLGKPMLITFIGLCVTYVIELFIILISIISMCFCENDTRYNYYEIP